MRRTAASAMSFATLLIEALVDPNGQGFDRIRFRQLSYAQTSIRQHLVAAAPSYLVSINSGHFPSDARG
jgi:hypothetical protein